MHLYPYLKPACVLATHGPELQVVYRGRAYGCGMEPDPRLTAAMRQLDGRTDVAGIARRSGVSPHTLRTLLENLAGGPVLLEGGSVVGPAGQLSGREAFWRLENVLWYWRSHGKPGVGLPVSELATQIGSGSAPVDVVKGYCLEICHQVSNAPTEIALAIGNSPSPGVRDLFMEFYAEEYSHGEILRGALASWLPRSGIDEAVPLPATAAMLHSYDWWAQTDVLMYAVALMRDEGSPLDAKPPEGADVYAGMREHYEVPSTTLDRFRWHATLDCDNDHGFFPELVFAEFPVIDPQRAGRLAGAARTIVELYDSLMDQVLAYYTKFDVESRWLPATPAAMRPCRHAEETS